MKTKDLAQKDDLPQEEIKVMAAAASSPAITNAWSHQGRVAQQTSHGLTAPLVRFTPEHVESERIPAAPDAGQAPGFAIPEAVLHERSPHKLPEDAICRSPIAGQVIAIAAAPGQAIQRRETVLIIEAMKMQNHISAETAGVIKAIHVQPGDKVKAGQMLFELD